MSLAQYRHWVFDMDGTLTLAVHDFDAIRVALDIPPEDDILHHLAALPEAEAAAKHAWLLQHERELARNARPAPGAIELVRDLHGRGCRLGILTRNAHELALLTLSAIGLDGCFATEDILGRGEAPPKPHPGGLLHLAERWQVTPRELVMVGDYRFDLDCGRAAGAGTVLVNLPENPWPELTDWFVRDCGELLGIVRSRDGAPNADPGALSR
jgi:HAD superfamily hydrolase (TIGR01509 family)